MEFSNLKEKKIIINDIPAIVLTSNNDSELYPTVIFYHGWSSSMEAQRFRGFILCSLGYQVIIPESIYHGSRSPINHSDPKNAGKYFWEVVIKNIEESRSIIDYSINNLKADPERIGVSGHSMGGFTAAGVFVSNPDLKTLAVLNGSCNWDESNKFFMEALEISEVDQSTILQEEIRKYDPINNLDNIIDRPILLLHGDKDSLVSIEAQRKFYQKVFPLYKDTSKIGFVEYPKLNHFVTTNMMEELATWFNNYL